MKQPKLTGAERLERIKELQEAIDEAELVHARCKSAAKKAKEQLEELRFRARRPALNMPEDEPTDEDGTPLFDADKTTGEIVEPARK